jgi:hypothetical protein
MRTIFDIIISWIPVVLLSIGVICGIFAEFIYVYYWILDLVS